MSAHFRCQRAKRCLYGAAENLKALSAVRRRKHAKAEIFTILGRFVCGTYQALICFPLLRRFAGPFLRRERRIRIAANFRIRFAA